MSRAGEIAALLTSLAFAFSSVFHTLAGRQVGSVIVNRIRLLLAITFLIIIHSCGGFYLPENIGIERLLWLSLSGIVGLALGDALLFQAFVLIGARLGMLLMSLAPVFAAILAWFFLEEKLASIQIIGMLLAISGVFMVIFDHNGGNGKLSVTKRNIYYQGILFGLGASVCQAAGLILARPGLTGDFPPISGTLIRMSAAFLVIWGITLYKRQILPTFRIMNRKSWLYLSFGAIIGPVLGVTLSLYAIQHAVVGIASTLIALTPIFLLPIGFFFFKERLGWKAVFGTILAMVGVGFIFLS